MKNVKIVYNGMFKNEASIILRMLESIYKHIDYYVIQDNGSTDGTPDIIKKFFEEKNIPGILYFEPWVNFGYNRNHALQKCLNADHGCDYILRVDADETLEVAEDFDWNILREKDAWNVTCVRKNEHNTLSVNCRMWIWSTKLPWEFTEFSRHETIKIKNKGTWTTGTLPDSHVKHILAGGGATWSNVYKFAVDALELEKDQLMYFLKTKELDSYHYYYIAKSYIYHFGEGTANLEYPFNNYLTEVARRGIWFFNCWLEKFKPESLKDGYNVKNDWWVSNAFNLSSKLHLYLKEDDKFIFKALKAYTTCPSRNDSIFRLIEYYYAKKEYLLALNYCKFIINNKFSMQLETEPTIYTDQHWKLPELYLICALQLENNAEAIHAAYIIKNASYYETFDNVTLKEKIKELIG